MNATGGTHGAGELYEFGWHINKDAETFTSQFYAMPGIEK
jgi:hypothetical protein